MKSSSNEQDILNELSDYNQSLVEAKFILDEEHQNGFFPLGLPTGSGKTFQACILIAELCKHGIPGFERVIFITEQKKNLPYKTLRNAFKFVGIGDRFDSEVITIISNTDCFQKAYENDDFNKMCHSILQMLKTSGISKSIFYDV
ncbi:MAG: DEAD/DEAH box helicase family protein [Candidatus Methanomethylophilus sp.]|jgi:type I site-specific restriction endonuclease|nr:DEAD/DEAH box helicase family protein [Methanomethylophilus sp.]